MRIDIILESSNAPERVRELGELAEADPQLLVTEYLVGRFYCVVRRYYEAVATLGRDRALKVHAGDLLAVCSAGAYGSSMSSNYNTRPRAPEVMVDGERFHVVRRRETIEELLLPESLLPK